jgi:hypothetical protein
MRDPGLAIVLSAIVPGIGQFYNGRILAGVLWLIITPGLWIGTAVDCSAGSRTSSRSTPPTPTPETTRCARKISLIDGRQSRPQPDVLGQRVQVVVSRPGVYHQGLMSPRRKARLRTKRRCWY